jgi:hypothetical protein
MTNGNAVPPAGALIDAIAAVKGLTVEGLLDEVNRLLVSRGQGEISRITWWKWRSGQSAPNRDHAIAVEDALGISARAWATHAQLSTREA